MSGIASNVATLQLQGEASRVQAAIDALALAPHSRWQQGERSRRGGVHACSGCSAVVADVSNPVALTDRVRDLLLTCQRLDYDFPALGLRAELSVAMSIGNAAQHVAAIEWSAADLRLLGGCGIDLGITAFPTWDDAAAEDDPLQDFWR